ncbi:patatin-like phospholipase family protein [Reinekea blandensis]|uniref:Patatin n=1 Tax=Reinekea blandensis MED297 TaxID=314283 RepID=A4BGB1_9GAMM|nr:patatin-like phospholipase family protein [Reinekea blandensis]EAR08906.1 Patatin [Reinekea sp. MED297] [Reinekea blandensis MED297]
MTKTVSLVLGSGGARGMAHIGVIRCLEDQGYQIKTIAGASIGALIGGFYAAGQLDRYQSWVCALERRDVLRLLDLSFTGGGIFKGDKLMEALRALVRDDVIENLPIEFTAVAVDLDRQKEIWFTDGSLFEAIRGSIAIPSVFKPHRYRNMNLVDGGVLNPVPVSAAMKTLTDMTVAVNLNAKRSPFSPPLVTSSQHVPVDQLSQRGVHRAIMRFIDRWRNEDELEHTQASQFSTLELLNRSIETMQNTIAHMKLSANIPDILVEVPYDCGGLFDYHLADEIIERGYALCLESLKRYEAQGATMFPEPAEQTDFSAIDLDES